MKTLQEKAAEVLSYFERATRDNGEDFTRTKDDTPQWVTDLCMDAHEGGQMPPDDHRYEFIQDALEILRGIEDPDEPHDYLDGDVDMYNADLLKWVASHLQRAFYVDDAVEDYGWNQERGLFGALMQGQYREREEVYYSVRESLENALDEDDADD